MNLLIAVIATIVFVCAAIFAMSVFILYKIKLTDFDEEIEAYGQWIKSLKEIE